MCYFRVPFFIYSTEIQFSHAPVFLVFSSVASVHIAVYVIARLW